MMRHDTALRDHLVRLLRGGQAHVTFEEVIAGWPARLRGRRPVGAPYTAWQLLEHMRIAQWDILDFCRNPAYVQPSWPDAYWPATASPPSDAAWRKSIRTFRRDKRAVQRLVLNPKTDLFARIPWGRGRTYLREALLVADHNAYHLGQLILLRRLLGVWEQG